MSTLALYATVGVTLAVIVFLGCRRPPLDARNLRWLVVVCVALAVLWPLLVPLLLAYATPVGAAWIDRFASWAARR